MTNDPNIKWYIIYTRPRAEKKVDEQLHELGIESYCPTRKVIRQWSDRKKKVEMVLFTSYVFVRMSEQDFPKLYDVHGFVRMVFYLGQPAVARDVEIDNIKIFLEQTTDHTVSFVPDQDVRIAEGPLTGKSGKIERIGKHSLRIRIEELGMSLVAEVHKNKVEAV
jgi:transcriptional antiterminator RfaH